MCQEANTKHFVCLTSFSPHINPMRADLREGNDLPKVTQSFPSAEDLLSHPKTCAPNSMLSTSSGMSGTQKDVQRRQTQPGCYSEVPLASTGSLPDPGCCHGGW